ncbi:MAG TPA: ParB/RepB/Spo0J family partition protein [Candidatus Saccharimonadales bacterium]|nr:ParB/RepB/Spo0J family partition protein [Candidatus Saccharimonadales bacterium]
MAKNRGLGRGFDALIPTDVGDVQAAVLASTGDAVHQIDPSTVMPNPHQPRQTFNEAELGDLAASIKTHGVLQPLVVSKQGDKYELIAGERRLRASKLAGLKTVPVIIRSFDEQQKLELALIENVQRSDLNPIETAMAYRKLVDEFNLTVDQVAQRAGQARSTVSNVMRLLSLSEPARQAVAGGQISEGHARAILSVNDEAKRTELLDLIIKNQWTVRQAEEFTRAFKAPAGSKEHGLKRIAGSNDLTKALESYLGTKVTMQPGAKGGKLVIAYDSDTELQRIIETINPN